MSMLLRGARTHACSVHTRVNASSPPIIRTGPCIFFSAADQPSLNRVSFDVSQNPLPLPIVAHPMVVRFPLPELLPRSPKYKVRPSGSNALDRLQQQARRRRRQQQHVHMIRHDGKCSEIVLAQFDALEQRGDHQLRDSFPSQERGAGSRTIQVLIPPDKCLPARELMRWRIPGVGKTPMEIPGNEEPLFFRIDVRQPAGRLHCSDSAAYPIKISPNPVRWPSTSLCQHQLVRAPVGVSTSFGASAGIRGARTHACSVHTRVNASAPFSPAHPSIPQRKCAPAHSTNRPANISRSHECERGTHECVRHRHKHKYKQKHECERLHNKAMGQINWPDNGAIR
jgi:hypothetical protein